MVDLTKLFVPFRFHSSQLTDHDRLQEYDGVPRITFIAYARLPKLQDTSSKNENYQIITHCVPSVS